LVGFLVLIAVGVGAAGAMFLPKLLNPTPLPLQPNAAPTTAATPKAIEPTPAPTETAPVASQVPTATTPSRAPAAPPRDVPRAPSERTTSKSPEPEAAPEPTPAPEKGLGEARGEDTTAPPFDPASAKSALTAAASGAASCKQPGGPTGTGRALVTFAPSGRVTKAEITGDFAGTGVGGCVARLFRGARVPKFAGEPTTVSKTFTIE
jgi:hypothetical protein